jgi:hypothetical protein
MAFGQSSGPPATGQQLRELLELLAAAGHTDFRDARGPMGFTQRQAAGKFTRDEADEFIERLQSEVYGEEPPVSSGASAPTSAPRPPTSKIAPRPQVADLPRPGRPRIEIALDEVPAEALAAELQRRGWVVLNPD